MISTVNFKRMLLLTLIGFVGFSMWQVIPSAVQVIQMMGAWPAEKITKGLEILFIDLLLLAGFMMLVSIVLTAISNFSNKLLFSQGVFLSTLLLFPIMFVAYFDYMGRLYMATGAIALVAGVLTILHWRYKGRLREVTERKEKKWAAIRASKEVMNV